MERYRQDKRFYWVSCLSLIRQLEIQGSSGRCFGHTQPKEGLPTDLGHSEGTISWLVSWRLGVPLGPVEGPDLASFFATRAPWPHKWKKMKCLILPPVAILYLGSVWVDQTTQRLSLMSTNISWLKPHSGPGANSWVCQTNELVKCQNVLILVSQSGKQESTTEQTVQSNMTGSPTL